MSTRAEVAHLYRRAGFGGTVAQLDAAEKMGTAATLQLLLNPAGSDPGATAPPALTTLDFSDKANRPALKTQGEQLALWWVARMATVEQPLAEKLVFFWHGHFATAIQKVKQPALMLRQNQIFRTMQTAPFLPFLTAVAHDPAMLVWLDAAQNKKGAANENFARELMELFTLGIGSYTEADVRDGARAFTGWTYDKASDAFSVRATQHDDGSKTFLGTTGDLSGDDVLKIVAGEKTCSQWVASRMWSRFATPVTPSDPVVASLAWDTGRPVNQLVAAVLGAPGFQATAGTLVKQPVEYVVGALHQLGVKASAADLTTLASLGQVPFDPPSVGGWPGSRGWLSTASSLAREDFAQRVVKTADLSLVADAPASSRPEAAAHLLGLDTLSTATRAALAATSDPATVVALALTSPEYVTQ